MFQDLIALFYPHLCAGCQTPLTKNEKVLCLDCKTSLPRTDYHRFKENPVQKLFWGRVMVESATSLLYFNKGGKVQHMLHQLKYKGNTEVGTLLGKELGSSIKNSELFKGVDAVMAVPLHPKKEKIRGYNQAQLIADGVAETLQIKSGNQLKRKEFTSTQTKKSRYDRWQNVETVFNLTNPESLKDKHVLLIDDVVTTGATMEACIAELLRVPGIKVSVATLACAH